MTSLYLTISILIPVLIGFSAVRACIPAERYWCRHDWLRLALGIGVGFGICSASLFIWLLAYGKTSPLYILVEIGLAAISAGVAVRRCTGCCLCKTFGDREPVRGTSLLLIAFWALFVSGCVSFMLQSRVYPDGQWDARAIWNLRARFLFRAGDQWRSAFSNKQLWTHPDYPLLVPAAVTRTWIYTGAEDSVAPAETAMLFTFATVGVLAAGLYTIAGRDKALMAGIVLLGTTPFNTVGTLQGGDTPTSFFVLSTIVLLFLEDWLPVSVSVLAGTTTALAAWTKNEGILFFVIFMIARKLAGRPMSAFLIGASWVFVLLGIFKLSMVPANDFFRQEWKSVLADIIDPSRYLLIVVGFLVQIARFGGVGLNPLIPLAYAYVVVGGKTRPGSRTALLTFTGVCIGFFVTYLLTPHDVSWHIVSSLDRLLLQLWPAALFTCFLVLFLPPAGGFIWSAGSRRVADRCQDSRSPG